ncbi:hypothetical protein HN51_054461 [Arachis hypogaea]
MQDEEALLLASLVVEDTLDRDFKHKKRSVLNSKTPPTNSRRKRRAQSSPESIRVAVFDLDEEETPRKDSEKKTKEKKATVNEESKKGGKESGVAALPCIYKLRDELSCAICLEICFEPSTTPCGHSFCKRCFRSATDKCGKKCPKCRQLIGSEDFWRRWIKLIEALRRRPNWKINSAFTAILAWRIWLARNLKIFEAKDSAIDVLYSSAVKLLEEFGKRNVR